MSDNGRCLLGGCVEGEDCPHPYKCWGLGADAVAARGPNQEQAMTRCEPPEGMRGRDGTHWLSHDIGGDVHLRPFWWDSRREQWVEVGKTYSSEEMTRTGWIYEGVIPTPTQLTALVKAAQGALGFLENEDSGWADDIAAALKPFIPQEARTDGQ